ncbi:hypothetical protein DBB36_04815 [Flavobacterium sp. WLB]|uniref:hypothetical protein n=1 Tax=unclassified Flavobacterium TaxID=196869 RepID=UPI0006ABD526|nr:MULTISPECIES: hypothetical protein [unclassified Flavobacterium]KOP39873.1 hypothetical protein AKO67_03075 [Flavobacterium sp. VMW]OWU92667.1 hypothetical protein APR43_00995 [Flavobacterium sp. NLM]PUU71183.1 hypothetical protein DBB36_04815 [Flavobacterium sp. WLB]
MKKNIIITTILLLSLCISPGFNAATPKQKHDNTTNKFYTKPIEFKLTQGVIVIPSLTYIPRNQTTGASGFVFPPPQNSWVLPAEEGDIIRFNLGGLIGFKWYTVTAEDEQSGVVNVDILNL